MKSGLIFFTRTLVLLLAMVVAGAPVVDYFDLAHRACHQGTEAPCEDPADGHCGGICHLVHVPFLGHDIGTLYLPKQVQFTREGASICYQAPPPGDIPVPPV